MIAEGNRSRLGLFDRVLHDVIDNARHHDADQTGRATSQLCAGGGAEAASFPRRFDHACWSSGADAPKPIELTAGAWPRCPCGITIDRGET